jgi:hypothetical protein
MNTAEPVRLYVPENVALGVKLVRHLRKKGWKQSFKTDKWVDPTDKEEHTFMAALKIQLQREGCAYV